MIFNQQARCSKCCVGDQKRRKKEHEEIRPRCNKKEKKSLVIKKSNFIFSLVRFKLGWMTTFRYFIILILKSLSSKKSTQRSLSRTSCACHLLCSSDWDILCCIQHFFQFVRVQEINKARGRAKLQETKRQCAQRDHLSSGVHEVLMITLSLFLDSLCLSLFFIFV